MYVQTIPVELSIILLQFQNNCITERQVRDMAEISELELQNLRHLIGGFDTTHCKLQEYANCATDAKIKNFFQKGAQTAQQNKEQLMKFL